RHRSSGISWGSSVNQQFRSTPWTLSYSSFEPRQELVRETLCTLGNGYIAVRGAAEEALAAGSHYPATYLAGVYNRVSRTIGGETVENEALVNWPNGLALRFRLAGEEWIDFGKVEMLRFHQRLHMSSG